MHSLYASARIRSKLAAVSNSVRSTASAAWRHCATSGTPARAPSCVAQEVNSALGDYRFHEAAQQVYSFFWSEFCDWYIELLKLRFQFDGTARGAGRTALGNAVALFEAALRLLSPFMPFLTEEVWHAIYDGKPPAKSIALSRFPQPVASQVNLAVETEMAILQDLIVTVRNVRAELKIEPRTRVPIRVFAEPAIRTLVDENRIRALFDDGAQGNEKFLSKAPANVVDGLRTRATELQMLQQKTQRALDELR